MWKSICRWILYRQWGWTTNITVDIPQKFLICLAPHTSNWDFVLGELYNRAEGMKIGFLMKKEWFHWPFGHLFRRMGGIPVCRTHHTSLTDQLAAEAESHDTFRLCITPEGTRSLNTEWKLGFYYIALKAHLPVLLYAADYEQKVIQCTKIITPNGDVESQMREIKLYYKDFKGKHPENFSLGEIQK